MATTHCQIKAKLTGERNMQCAASSRYTPLHPIAAGIAISALVAGAGGALASDCGDLAGKVFGPATITAATTVSPPSSLVGRDPPTPVAIKAPFCRVEGVIKPSADSDIKFEVWLPPESAWNGKYGAIGNGGFAGSLILPSMAWRLEEGYAVSGTDTGHAGGPLDAAWALGHPEKIADFGWRGVHVTAEASKGVINAYYGRAPSRSYFAGCSDGGREALMAAQRFPKDFDGIVAGAPANYWTNLMSNAAATMRALNQPGAWLSPEDLAVVSEAAQRACPSADGYLDNPGSCRFDPSTLVCKPGQNDRCLSQAQLGGLKAIYAGTNDADGKPINPGYPVGGEAGPVAWSLWITGTDPKRAAGSLLNGFSSAYFANMVFDKPDWAPSDGSVAGDWSASQKNGEALDAANPDLTAFKAAGGKLIQYHGWSDAAIPASSSIDYYKAVADRMGGVDQIRPFYRLFLAPGMMHCGLGPGPGAVGGVFGQPSPGHDPEHDVLAALARWVEKGVSPESIIATRYKDDDPGKGVAAQRPWCAYPAVARFSGKGEHSDAANFTCVAPSE
jgi:feruloyl esterase